MRASASASGSLSWPLAPGLLVCLVTLLGACGGGGGAPLCVPGNSRSCAAVGCPHGAGTQMCEQTGIYTTCLCDGTTGGAGSTGTAASATDAGGDVGTAGATVDGAADADASAMDGDAAADATSGEVGPDADATPDGAAHEGEARDGEAYDGGATDAPGLEVAPGSDGSTGDDSAATDAPLTCQEDADACTPDAASD